MAFARVGEGARVELPKDPVAAPRHQSVGGVEEPCGEDVERTKKAPRVADAAQDPEHRAPAADDPLARPAAIEYQVKRVELLGILGMAPQDLGGRGPLERRESEAVASVAPRDEAHRAVAEPADAVVEER